MNKFLLLIILSSFAFIADAQVKIGSLGTPNANAVLELDGGTSKGLLLPRLSAQQITLLTTAPDGLLVYNTTDGFLYIRKVGTWIKITDEFTAGGGLTLPFAGSAAATAGNPVLKIQNSSSGTGISGEALGAGYGVFGYSNTGTGGYFSSQSGPALMTGTGNVGIGTPITSLPQFPLDVVGRVRLRNRPNESPGIWFEKISTPLAQSSFFGVVNDSIVGLYGVKDNAWKFFFNHDNNNFGINNSNPRAPLSFQAFIGNKIDFFYQSPTAMYGMGIQAAELQLYTNDNTAHTSIGYGSSAAFTETFRVNNNGLITNTNPSTLLTLRTAGTLFKTGNNFTGGIKTLGTSATTARLGLYGHVSSTEGGMVEYLSINDDGKVGLNNIFPTNPLSFPATLEKKISLYPGATGDVGLAVSGNELRIYSDNSNAVTTIGYDDFTNGFKEIYRVVPTGTTELTNPVTNAANVQTAAYFKSANTYNGAIKTIGTGSSSARMGLFTYATSSASNLKEAVTILDGGNVGVNVINPNSKLQVEGSVSLPFKSLNADYTATDNDHTLFYDLDVIGSLVATITLPAAAGRKGRIYVVAASIPYHVQGGGISGAQFIFINNELGNNIFEDNPGLQDPNGSTYDCLMNYKFSGLATKRKLSVTFQSDGAKWKAIDNSFQF